MHTVAVFPFESQAAKSWADAMVLRNQLRVPGFTYIPDLPRVSVPMTEVAALAWGAFLSRYQWDYFCTLTYDPRRITSGGIVHSRPTVETLFKSWRRFVYRWILAAAVRSGLAAVDQRSRSRVVAAKYGRRIVRRRIDCEEDHVTGRWINRQRRGVGLPVWVVGFEYRSQREGLHAHSLLKLTDEPRRLDFSEGHAIWNESRGRAWLEAPKSSSAVGTYVSKYVVKDGDIMLSPTFVSDGRVPDVPLSGAPGGQAELSGARSAATEDRTLAGLLDLLAGMPSSGEQARDGCPRRGPAA